MEIVLAEAFSVNYNNDKKKWSGALRTNYSADTSLVPSGLLCKDASIPYHGRPSPLHTLCKFHCQRSCNVCHLLYRRSQRLGQQMNPTDIKTVTDAPQLWLSRAPQFSPSQTPVAWVATPNTPRHTGVAPANTVVGCGCLGPGIQCGYCQINVACYSLIW